MSQAAPANQLPVRLAQLARTLESRFLGKDEVIRLLLIAVVAGEHAVLIGPPGTAKSALIRMFARLLQASYFEYLLTRFTEPNEIFGPVDIAAFREGRYQRRIEGMLPASEVVFLDEVFKSNSAILNALLTRFTEPNEIFGPVDIAAFREGRYQRRIEGMLPASEVVFLDEVFKSNSAILNALLTLLNERRYTSGGVVLKCPLLSCFGASNEVPTDETLTAIFDRFLLRIRSDNLDAYHFQDLLTKGVQHEIMALTDAPVQPIVSAREIQDLHRQFAQRMRFTEEFFSQYKGLVFQIRAEGVSLSDRRVVKLLKLFAASAFLDGRAQPDASDFFVLKHIWNNEDQSAILESIVTPVLEAHYRDHPNARRVGAAGIGIEALAGEIDRVRQVLTGGGGLSDVQLFSQLKALNEIKAALGASPDPRAPELVQRVDQLLEAAFRSGRFAQL